ncbi:mpv17-like protein 2 [Scaptodrosophila lebanonensis]|uniref:Mpv17-like protein 2 n=1 Tax=Drosophila lebanonensis TaxID=7225 RepID=A0A6J2TD77_DROLE|nr:mpv17-like protein 2 [Scaptodrosophila lebanonensis]
MDNLEKWKLKVVAALKRLNKVAFSQRYLLYTNLGISIGLAMVGDQMEQGYECWSGHIDKWDRTRTIRMGISGFTVGIVCHYWYQYLDQFYPKRTLRAVVHKILLDQFICSPFYITVFFITMGVLEDKTWEEMKEEIREKAIILYTAEWTVWPAAQFVNFFLIPPRYRVVYDNIISLGYDVYMSNVKYRKTPNSSDTTTASK